jgi:JAB1/Mov34/MPN/PAD-1 ubiquitin protease
MEIDPNDTTTLTTADTANGTVEDRNTDSTGTDEFMMTRKLQVAEVVIHPLVLLSVADHYHRVARGTRKRVIGILLGQVTNGIVDATNSFALPFEEDSKNPVPYSHLLVEK